MSSAACSLTSINNEDQNGNEKCAGKSCNNLGSVTLRIRYINKVGDFCCACSEYLLEQGLATKVGEADKTGPKTAEEKYRVDDNDK